MQFAVICVVDTDVWICIPHFVLRDSDLVVLVGSVISGY